MIDAGKFVGGQFIGKDDLADGPLSLTIQDVSTVTFPAKGERPADEVLVLHFDDDRRFALSAKINVRVLIKTYGRDASKWIGKPIVVYRNENVSFGSSIPGGNRIRVPQAAVQAAATVRDIELAMPTVV